MTFLSKLFDLLRYNESFRAIAGSVVLIILTAITTHFFDVRKIKEQQKISLQDSVEKRIVEACIAVRDLLLRGRTQEIFDVQRIGKDRFRPTISDSAIFPSYANDRDAFLEYALQISETRRLYEPYLSVKSTAFLLIYEQYFLELAHLIGLTSVSNRIQLIGALTMVDVQKIRKDFDDVLIKEINRPTPLLESKNTRKYEKLKETYRSKYIDQSVLMKIKRNDEVKNLLSDPDVPGYIIVNQVYALCFGGITATTEAHKVTTP